jgi:rubrerythrin
MIDEKQVASILSEFFNPRCRLGTRHGTTVSFDAVVKQIVGDINQDLATATQMDTLKKREEYVRGEFEGSMAVLDREAARITSACPHRSTSEREGDGLPLVICNVCGYIVEEEMTGV